LRRLGCLGGIQAPLLTRAFHTRASRPLARQGACSKTTRLGASFGDAHRSIPASPEISALRRMSWQWCAPRPRGRLLRARHLNWSAVHAADCFRRRAARAPGAAKRQVLPQSGRCPKRARRTQEGGNASFPIWQARDAYALKAVIEGLKPQHPTLGVISALPLAGRGVEEYSRPKGVTVPRSRGSPHGRSGVAARFGP
jgi:hypothetical protein